MNLKILFSVLVLFSLLASCNMPTGQVPVTQPPGNEPVSMDTNAIATAVELTAVARVTELAGSVTATSAPPPTATLTPTSSVPTQCAPLVTATVNANVRSGPDTAYDIIGALTLGQTATIVGRNDAYTWWYIDYPAAAGGHAWIAGSVVTSACVPAVVQVVAAPPLPTLEPTLVADNSNDEDDSIGPLVVIPNLELQPLLLPDLIVSEFTISPATPIMGQNAHVRIGAYNKGKAASGQFIVKWYGLSTFPNPTCSWTVDSLPANGGRILECNYAFPSWYPVTKTSLVIVDANNQVNESNEGNNQGTITPFGVAKP